MVCGSLHTSCFLCVQELERLGLGQSVDLYVCEVPVEYQAVQSLLPYLWKQHQPQVAKINYSKSPSVVPHFIVIYGIKALT